MNGSLQRDYSPPRFDHHRHRHHVIAEMEDKRTRSTDGCRERRRRHRQTPRSTPYSVTNDPRQLHPSGRQNYHRNMHDEQHRSAASYSTAAALTTTFTLTHMGHQNNSPATVPSAQEFDLLRNHLLPFGEARTEGPFTSYSSFLPKTNTKSRRTPTKSRTKAGP